MAPRDPSIEATSEYTEFIEKLKAYHLKRGTNFDPEPKAGGRHTDLLKLYKIVTEVFGGYDALCRVKKGWPSLATDRFNLGHPDKNPGAGFQLKTCYYKFLAAYEIENFFHETPPPREILEDQTAGGGDLRTRTLENYKRGRDGTPRAGSSGASNEGTPSRDRVGSEETPGSGGRPSRLRERPPQRAMYSDTQAAQQTGRQTRNVSTPQAGYQANQGQHGQRGYNPASFASDHNQAVVNYEPRPTQPLSLRPVLTPGNNPVEWTKKEKLRIMKEKLTAKIAAKSADKGMMLPGSGYDGPNIYVRCLCALKSGMPAEQSYALHHMVKISMERGDKYKLEGFPGLAEELIRKILEVSSLLYNVDWEVTYFDDAALSAFDALDGLNGTPDLLEKIKALDPIGVDDNIQDAKFQDAMLLVNEAALVLRNMMLMDENAAYVSTMAPLRDALVIVLNLPKLDTFVELKNYALDIAESLTKHLEFDEKDTLYISLLAQVQETSDRGTIITALGAINKISMLHEEKNPLLGVPLEVIHKMVDWLLLGHDELLVGVCLDFLNQYTDVVPNVDFLLRSTSLNPLITQLVRLLRHGTQILSVDTPLPGTSDTRIPDPGRLAPLPVEVIDELRKTHEPDRVVMWLRCLFEEDEREQILQLELWQAYQACFTPMLAQSGTPMLTAPEFVKHVTSSFTGVAAQVDYSTPVQRYTIKGLRFRSIPVDSNLEPFKTCLWRTQHGIPCGQFFTSPEPMYNHVLKAHLRAVTNESGMFVNQSGPYSCAWGQCDRFAEKPANKLAEFAGHLKVHLPRPSKPSTDADHKKPPSYIKPGPTMPMTVHVGQYKEYHDANGQRHKQAIGLHPAALDVLRNLARNIRKTPTAEVALKERGESLTEQLFKPVEPQLFEVMTCNKLLTLPLSDMLQLVKLS